jgi:hypothetical protein
MKEERFKRVKIELNAALQTSISFWEVKTINKIIN